MPTAIAIFDHNIVLQLNSLVGRFPRFDSAIEFLSENDLKDAIFVTLLWWYWFRRANTATTWRTREHLLCTLSAGGTRDFRGQNQRSDSTISRAATVRPGAALPRARGQYQRPR